MIYFLVIFISFYMTANAGEAIIIKYNSFLFQEPTLSSLKLKILNKGDRIFIHDKYFDPSYKNLNQEVFLESLDQNGQPAFILQDDIKLIFQNLPIISTKRTRKKDLVSINQANDSSDFRPQEPLSSLFPFKAHEYFRGMFDVGRYSTGSLIKYNYPSVTTKENFGTGIMLRITMLKKANWDQESRFFIGGNFVLTSKPSSFNLANGLFSTELNTTFEIGPSISYDFYKMNSVTLTIISSLNILYHKYFIKLEKPSGAFEERKFSSFTIKPSLSFLWQYMPTTSQYNIYTGFSAIYSLNHKLSADSIIQSAGVWNTVDDFIGSSSAFEWSIFLGISNHF